MMIPSHMVQFRKAGRHDYAGLLVLQKENLITNLSEADARHGFLSVEYTGQQFDEINTDLGIAVAVSGKTVLGYLCGSSFGCAEQFLILRTMLANLNGRTLAGTSLTAENTFVYGPACIAAPVRGSGVLGGLFDTMKKIARPRYSACVLFIAGKNQRSFEAHSRKLGMSCLGVFEFQGKEFHLFCCAC